MDLKISCHMSCTFHMRIGAVDQGRKELLEKGGGRQVCQPHASHFPVSMADIKEEPVNTQPMVRAFVVHQSSLTLNHIVLYLAEHCPYVDYVDRRQQERFELSNRPRWKAQVELRSIRLLLSMWPLYAETVVSSLMVLLITRSYLFLSCRLLRHLVPLHRLQ
jgi:hypothetical protein